MITRSANYLAVECATERQVGWLFHVFAVRAGIVTLPNGWGSWCYSNGFQTAVDFTDARDYAGDGVQSRTYSPAAIEADDDALGMVLNGENDAQKIELVVDPSLEPLASYVNNRWPLRFGLVIYKVHRNGDELVLADDLPVSEIRFVGFLKSSKNVFAASGRKLKTEWESIHGLFSRKIPGPVFSLRCTKKLFATGPAALACNADKAAVLVEGTVAAMSSDVIRAIEWAAKDDGWFANGLIEYDAVDPVSGLTFTFALDVISSKKVLSGEIEYGELLVSPTPPLSPVGLTVRAYGGCDRSRETCISKFDNLDNFGGAPDMPIENPSLESYR